MEFQNKTHVYVSIKLVQPNGKHELRTQDFPLEKRLENEDLSPFGAKLMDAVMKQAGVL